MKKHILVLVATILTSFVFVTGSSFALAQSPSPTPAKPTVNLIPTATNINSTGVTLGGEVTNRGTSVITDRGFDYGLTTAYSLGSKSANPPHNVTGQFTASITGLTCNTTYHYRSYARNGVGITYSGDGTFTTGTCAVSFSAREPFTPTQFAATLRSQIVSTGGSDIVEVGFEYSKDTSYTGLKKEISRAPYRVGIYSLAVIGLDCGTTYNYRPYARNASGTHRATFTQTFTTAACPPPPTVDVPTSSGITRYSVILQGKTLSGIATEVGFEYSKFSGGPYTKQILPTVPAVGSVYSSTIENLEPDTVYYFRSYAKNAGGTTYSAELNFKTNVSPTKIKGWAWSSNIGWVNIDGIRISADTGKVGNLEGFAWSPNIGWIKFHDLYNYPTTGSPGVPANINLETGEVKGWIRACAGTVGGETNQNGADCRSMTSRTDGWDGWIELVGNGHMLAKSKNNLGVKMANAQTTSNQGLRMNVATGDLTGMAWGGEVIGWLNFNGEIIQRAFSATCSGVDAGNNTINFTASATGGSGNYQYKWGSEEYSDNPIKNVVIGSSNSVTIPLYVKDVGNNTVSSLITCQAIPAQRVIIIPEPGCTIDGADASKNKVINPKGSIVIRVGPPSPISSTYKYVWKDQSTQYGETANGVLSHSHTYGDSVTGERIVSVDVIDITNPSSPYTRNFYCGIVTVKQPGINLYIGPTGARANKTSFLVKKGEPFGLAWENTLPIYSAVNPDGYQCNNLVVPSSASGNWGDWIGADTNSVNGLVNGLGTSEVGSFKFVLNCENDLGDIRIASSTIKVFFTTGSEI